MTPFDTTDRFSAFQAIVNRRRSVRVFTEEAIPDGVIDKAIDMSLLAPNSSNLQPWEFFWVREPVKKARLVEYCLKQAAARSAAELVVIVGRTNTWDRHRRGMVEHLNKLEAGGMAIPHRVQQYYRLLTRLAYRSWFPWTVVKWFYFNVPWLWKANVHEPVTRTDMRVWAVKSASLAAQNFMMAISAQGYDSCPMEGVDSRRIGKMLGLPCRSYIVMVVAVGRARDVDTSRGAPLPRYRVPREWVVHKIE